MKALRCANLFRSASSTRTARRWRRPSLRSRICGVEALEERQLLTTLAVTTLDDSGPGSLRRAIQVSNALPGPDRIAIRGRRHDPRNPDVPSGDHRRRPARRDHGAGLRRIAGGDDRFPGLARAAVRDGGRRIDPPVALAGEGRRRGRHATRLRRDRGGQLHRPACRRADRRRQPGRRRADRPDLARQPDRPDRSGDEHRLLQRRRRGHPAGHGLAGHSRCRHQRPVPDHRDVGRQRAAVRGADLGRRRDQLPGQLPGRHDHERLRPRQSRWRPRPAGRQLQERQRHRAGLPLPGHDRRPLAGRQLPDDRLPRRDVQLRPQHDGRPRGRQRRRAGRQRPHRHRPRLPLRHRRECVPAGRRLPGLDRAPPPTASGTTAARATRSPAATPTSSGRAARSARATWSTTTPRPASSPTGRRSSIPTGRSARITSPTCRASAATRRASTRSPRTRSRAVRPIPRQARWRSSGATPTARSASRPGST